MVEKPTFWKMMETVPFSRSYPAMVRGTRSPCSSTRKMMNWPALAFLATKGASISMRVTAEFSSFFRTILYIILILSFLDLGT